MNYIDLPKPHGYLIWRRKQKAIASPTMLPVGEKLLVVSNDEAYGEIVLSSPSKVSISELEKREEGYHCLRAETRKLLWPEVESFFIHEFKEWQPFEAAKMVDVNNGSVEFIEARILSEAQKQLLEKANRLPKIVPLLNDAVVWEGDKAIIQDGLQDKIKPILDVVLEDARSDDLALSLYQLALVRAPVFRLEKKSDELEAEKAMPYKATTNHPDCEEEGKPVGLVNKQTGKLMGCHEDMESAMAQAEAIMAEEDKGKTSSSSAKPPKKAGRKKELNIPGLPEYDDREITFYPAKVVPENEKCGPMESAYAMGGATSFADMMAMEEMQEQMMETSKLTSHFGMLASNIMASPDISDKGAALKALAEEYAGLVGETMNHKMADVEEDEKAEGLGGYLVSSEEGDHLPTKRNGKVDHRLMGAAWAALHGGYRGNKYEGPNKQEAIRKLTALYKSEGLDTPGSKGDEEVPEEAKAGRRMRASMMDKLKSAWATIKELMDWAEEPMMDDEEEMMGMAGFSKGYGIAVKTVNGEPWLITYSTNAFQDREKEIFSTKSLEQYVGQAEKQNDRGTFNLWHIPGSDFAEKRWQAVPGRFLVEAGPFLRDEKGQAALEFFKEYSGGHPDIAPEGWGCSPEYRYLPEERKTGTYENIWITRTSILPRLAAANVWTKAGIEMAYTEQQKQAANTLFGEKLAAKILGGAEDATKELEEAGVGHKGDVETATPGESVTITQATGLTAEQLATELQPFAEAMNVIGEQLVKLQAGQEELSSRVKSLEKTEEIKAKTETPRATLFSFKRASEAEKTVVAEDDALKGKKPVETPKPQADTSGAAAFFPAR